MCVRMSRSKPEYNKCLFNIQIYIDIYVRVSFGGHNLGIFKLGSWFGMLFTQTQTFSSVLELLLGHALGWD